jgi:hypothetical protein
MKLDNPLLVRWESASEQRLAKHNPILRALIEDDNPEDMAFDTVAETQPKRLLDVGCGPGDVTQRFVDELGGELIADDAEPQDPLSFNGENGGDLLGNRFARVERRDVEATLIFPTTESIREFVASTIDRAHLAPRVPDIVEPFRVTTHHVIFVGEQPQ